MAMVCFARLRAAGILMVAVAALMESNCAKRSAKPVGPMPIPVLAAQATRMDIPLELHQIGTVEAINAVAVTARVGGQLQRVAFKEGQNVPKGALLFQIDPGPYQTALAQAKSTLRRDSAAMINAENTAARYKDLAEKEYVARQDYETTVANAAEARATVESDHALVKTAAINLGYCTVVAPIAGRTGNLNMTEGNLVTANGPNPLVTINQISPIYVRFAIPQENQENVRRRARQETLSVWTQLSNDTQKIEGGELSFIDNAIDQATGTILLKATFPNTDRALWPGQFVQTGLILGKKANAVVVPAMAVQTLQQGAAVYVIMPGDTVDMRRILAGATAGDMTEVVQGVTPGERIVTDGALQVRQGSKVVIKSGLSPLEASGARRQ